MQYIVNSYKERYQTYAVREEKTLIIDEVVKAIRGNEQNRFLRRISKDSDSLWCEVSSSEAFRKVAHSLRGKTTDKSMPLTPTFYPKKDQGANSQPCRASRVSSALISKKMKMAMTDHDNQSLCELEWDIMTALGGPWPRTLPRLEIEYDQESLEWTPPSPSIFDEMSHSD